MAPLSPGITSSIGSSGWRSSGHSLIRRVPEPWSQLAPLLVGVPGFYHVNPALAWGVDARVGIEQAAMYLVDPLKKLLPAIVDFDLINSGKTRFTLGLTTVQTGQMRYFDNKRETIGLEHVLGSMRLAALLSRSADRRRILLGRRRLFKFAD